MKKHVSGQISLGSWVDQRRREGNGKKFIYVFVCKKITTIL